MNNFGHIDIEQFGDWFRHLSYGQTPVPTVGFTLVDPEDIYRYTSDGMNVYLSRDINDNFKNFLNAQFNWVDQKSYSVQKIKPSMVLPLHKDRYGFFSKANNITDIENILRIIIFLEDWQSGHISEVNNKININYKAGDWISWTGSTVHLAANLGHTDRYTLQLTGILK
jgi:hypothetical protein